MCLSLILAIASAGSLRAGSLPLIEVEVEQEKLQGRVDAHGDNFF
jgi:hypothetical protein